jgi:integrase
LEDLTSSGGLVTPAWPAPSESTHDLRHTYATLLRKQGMHIKFFQELLGHGDVSLTLNVYSYVPPDMGDATGAIDEALGG